VASLYAPQFDFPWLYGFGDGDGRQFVGAGIVSTALGATKADSVFWAVIPRQWMQ
jgi:hypothetical protein